MYKKLTGKTFHTKQNYRNIFNERRNCDCKVSAKEMVVVMEYGTKTKGSEKLK